MARTMRWIAGERPGVATNNEGAIGGDGTGWTRQTTTIAPGGFSVASYGRNLNTAAASSTLQPYSASGGDMVLNASKIGWTFWLHCSDWTPADFVVFSTIIPASGTPAYAQIVLSAPTGTAGALSVSKSSDASPGASTGAIFTDGQAAYVMVTVEWNGTTSYRWRLWVWGGNTPSGNAFSGAGWGSALIDFTETDAAITGGIHRVGMRATGNSKGVSPATQVYLDDMCTWTFDTDADLPTAPDTVWASSPTGAGTDSGFTGGTGTNPDFNDVDDLDADDDTTYDESVLTTAVQENQTYALANIPALPAGATIPGVDWYAKAKSSSASPAVCQVRGYIDGVARDSGTNWLPSTSAYVTAHYCMALTPVTLLAWTETLVNGMECGLRESAVSSRTVRLTQCFANIAVMPSLGGGSRGATLAGMSIGLF